MPLYLYSHADMLKAIMFQTRLGPLSQMNDSMVRYHLDIYKRLYTVYIQYMFVLENLMSLKYSFCGVVYNDTLFLIGT